MEQQHAVRLDSLTEPPSCAPVLIITAGRVGYQGLYTAKQESVLGATTIYVAINRPFMIRTGGVAHESMFAMVPAHVPHWVFPGEAELIQLIIEDECIDPSWRLDGLAEHRAEACRYRILEAFKHGIDGITDCQQFDCLFFGKAIPERRMDWRIRRAVMSVRANPAEKHSAEAFAVSAGLSASRFSHLFRTETGHCFRSYCAWRRARAVMTMIKKSNRLTEMALDAGYADSTHFSHSMRRYWGIQPRGIAQIERCQQVKLLTGMMAA